MKVLIESKIDSNIQLEDRDGKIYLVHYSDTNIKETKAINLTAHHEVNNMDAENLHLMAMAFFSRSHHNGRKPRYVEYYPAGSF